MKVNVVGPLVVAAAAMHIASAAPCTSLTQNILTSVACPTSCAGNACVLYSPSQTEGCTTRNASAAGACYTDSTFTPAGDAGPCDLTYQCLVSLTDSASSPKWYLALTANNAMNKVTTAPVTEISQLKYPPNGKVSIVQLAGGLGKNARGNIKNVILDDSFFLTPDSVHSFYLSEINLEQFLDKVDFATRTWTSVSMNNANLHAVPAGFAKLALTYVELKKNFITNISDASLFSKVTELHLEYNDITNITAVLPAVETLNLTGNPLTKIPDAIFQMKTLKALSLLECNISNPQVTTEQFTFLEQLQKFEATPAITECASGYGPKNLTNGRTVCLQGSPSAADLASGGKKSSNHTVVIVVAIIGGVVVVSLVAFLVLRRRKSTSDHYSTFNKDPTTTNGTDFTEGSDTYGSSSIWNDPDLLAVRIEFRDIEPIKLLSRGGFGEVWLGLYMNENVAIKRLLADKKTMNDALAFASEIKTMARLDHPKIVRFIGVAWTNALTIQAVTEFMDCGDLRSLLDSSRASSLTWANLKCQIAIDVADALVYLHTLNPKLIHRDLKSRNVLIDANSGAKLSDFGISRNRSVEETMTAGVGTARWIAPEVILGGHYTEFADIYSFGVVLSELDTNKAPFHDATNTNGAKMQDVTILQLVSAGKLQPSFTNTCPEPIIRLAKACMSFDPAQRPSAIHISYELRKILKDEL